MLLPIILQAMSSVQQQCNMQSPCANTLPYRVTSRTHVQHTDQSHILTDVPRHPHSILPLLKADTRPLNVTHKISTACLHPPPRYQRVLRTVHPDQHKHVLFSQYLPRSDPSITPRSSSPTDFIPPTDPGPRIQLRTGPHRTAPITTPRAQLLSRPAQPSHLRATEPPIPSTSTAECE